MMSSIFQMIDDIIDILPGKPDTRHLNFSMRHQRSDFKVPRFPASSQRCPLVTGAKLYEVHLFLLLF